MRFARWTASWILVAITIGVAVHPLSASEPISYSLRSWTTRDGLPGHLVRVFAQDRDGYLWVGTERGLARFDGFRFITWDLGGRLEGARLGVTALLAASDGSLWVSYSTVARVDRIQGNNVTTFLPSDGLIQGTIREILEDRDGQIWAGGRGGLSVFRAGSWRRVALGSALQNETVTTLFEDQRGYLWVGSTAGVFRRQGQTDTFIKVGTSPVLAQGFVTDPDGDVFVLDQHLRWGALTGQADSSFRLKIDTPLVVGSPAGVWTDRDGYWWVAFQNKGLVRVNPKPPHSWQVFSVENGLSGNQVMALFQDREGTLWAGTEDGVTQLSAGNITNFLASGQLPVPRVLTADHNGAVWIGTHAGLVRRFNGEETLYRSRDGLLNGVSAIHADGQGAIWIATADGLVCYRDNAFGRVPLPVELRTVSALTTDWNGRLWIADNEKGLYWWDNHTLRHIENPPGLFYQQVSSFFVDRRGRVWVGLFSGAVAVYDGREFSYPYGTEKSLPGAVVSILEDADDLFLIVTTNGLTWIRDGGPSTLSSPDTVPMSRLTAAVQSANGDLWIASEDSIIKIKREDRQSLAREPSQLRYEVYDDSDGLVGHLSLFARGYPKAALDHLGNLWVITTSGVAVVNASSTTAHFQLPDVSIDAVLADDRRLESTPDLRLPAGVSRLQLDYNAVSLRAPKKVRFQRMLEGLDEQWVDDDRERRATYAALPPGHYLFRVRARIAGADWPEDSTAWEFDVPPAFYETSWFLLACLGTLAIAGWGAWALRVRQIHTRFALVMGERSRVAREIHDTLLQSLVGLGLHLDNVSDELVQSRSSETVRGRLRSIRKQVESSVVEARQSIWNLRKPQQTWPEFCEALREVGHRVTENAPVRFTTRVHGAVSPVPGVVQEQILRIVQEAINNAVHHSEATRIRLDVYGTKRSVRVRISDDGRGFEIDQAMTHANGHWGITFMHERALQVGGQVDVMSSPAQGTTVECEVPLSDVA